MISPASEPKDPTYLGTKHYQLILYRLYSFFNNFSTACSAKGASSLCQTGIVQYDAASTKNFWIYGLNTVGAYGMVYRDTTKLVDYSQNVNVFPSSIIVFSSST